MRTKISEYFFGLKAPSFKIRPLPPIRDDDLDDEQLGITQRTPPQELK